MIAFIGSGLVIGGLLGVRFTVLAIIPAAALAVDAAALAWAGQAGAPDWGWLDLVAPLVFHADRLLLWCRVALVWRAPARCSAGQVVPHPSIESAAAYSRKNCQEMPWPC